MRTTKAKILAAMAALAASDLLAVSLSYGAAFWLRHWLAHRGLSPLIVPHKWSLLYLFLAWGFALIYEGLYTRRYPFWEELRRLWRASLAATLLLIATTFIAKESPIFSRAIVLMGFALACALVPAGRAITRRILVKLGLWARSAVVFAGREANTIKKALEGDLALGYRVIATYNHPPQVLPKMDAAVIEEEHFDNGSLRELVERVRGVAKEVLLIPYLGENLSNLTVHQVGRLLVLKAEEGLLTTQKRLVKNLVDYSLALVLTIALLPLMAIIWLAIKLDSPGPAIFRQTRMGRKGKPFRCLKFRTMHTDAERRLAEILKNPEAKKEWEEYHKFRKFKDPRITRVGRFLRKYSLDEIPQFFNVLRGEMSLVGPRPFILEEAKKMGPHLGVILNVKPGITGLWQVSGRNDLTFKERIMLDTYYVTHWSLWLDLAILLKTFKAVINKRGAY